MSRLLAGILAAYADLIDGVRSWYARREGDNWLASFSATMVLSMLMGANVFNVVAVSDLLVNEGLTLQVWNREYRALVLVVGILIAALHLLFAKLTGVYDRRGGPRSETWRTRMRIYIATTIGAFAFVIVGILLTR